MMKGSIGHKTCSIRLRSLAMALWLLTSGGAATAAGNNVHLYGALVAEPCVIPPGQEKILLDFGTIVDKYLFLNSRTLGQAFSIRLTECDVSLGNTVKVSFIGMEHPTLPGLLAIDSGSGASGIAIGLETPQAKPLPLNRASDSFPLQDGNNTIALKAYVRGDPQAITGKSIARGAFTATVTFRLEYE
jgi:type 1 fimbria pilin